MLLWNNEKPGSHYLINSFKLLKYKYIFKKHTLEPGDSPLRLHVWLQENKFEATDDLLCNSENYLSEANGYKSSEMDLVVLEIKLTSSKFF